MGQWKVVWQEYFCLLEIIGGLCGCLLNAFALDPEL